MIFESFSVILRQISLGVHSHAVAYFPCLTKKSFKNRDFWVFAVTLGQMSLGVPTVRCRLFSLSYEKILQKSRFLGLCRNARSNVTRSTDSTLSFIFLVLRKNPSKIETLGLFGDTATNIARSTDSTPSLIFLVLRKNSSKIEILGLFVDTASNITRSADSTLSFIFLVLRKNPSKIESLGLCRNARLNITRNTFVRRRLFSLSYEKILQKSRVWVFAVMLGQMSLGVHSHTVVHFPCLTKKSFKNRDFGTFR